MSLSWTFFVALLLTIPAFARQSSSAVAPDQPSAHSANTSFANDVLTEVPVECLPASRAWELLGNHGCVAGRVSLVTVGKSGNTRVSLCPPKRGCFFHAVVSKRDHNSVGDVSYLRGRVVAFVGDVTNYRGHPEIIVKDREQVRVTAGNPPPEFDVTQAKAKFTPTKRNRAW